MIIKSMLDNDLYKFTMMQAVLHQFPGVEVEYRFKCRTEGVNLLPHVHRIVDEVDAMCSDLSFSQDELGYLSGLRFIKPDFVQFLKLFRFERDYVRIGRTIDGELDIRVKGPWLHTILFEVPILAIVSEVYSSKQHDGSYMEAEEKLTNKVNFARKEIGTETSFNLAEFGTRRRESFDWQFQVVADLATNLRTGFVGTSNV